MANLNAEKKPQVPEMFIFKHMIPKLEEDSDFMPLGEVSAPLIKVSYILYHFLYNMYLPLQDLLKEIDEIDKNPSIVLSHTFTMDSSLKTLFQRALTERLAVIL